MIFLRKQIMWRFSCDDNTFLFFITRWLALIKRYWQHVESKMENSSSLQNVLKVSKKQQRKRIEKPSYRVRLGKTILTKRRGCSELLSTLYVLATY